MSTTRPRRAAGASGERRAHESDTRFLPEKASWKKSLEDFGMRSVGRLAVGLNTVLGSRAATRAGILMYHRVADHVPGLPAPLHNVRPRAFREQMQGLLSRGYEFWSLARLLEHRDQDGPIPGQVVVVTFDDGFQSVYTNAWPVLRKLEIPATVFVNTAYLDDDRPFPFDAWGVACQDQAPPESYRPLTIEQCREMAESGLVAIGAHTHTHTDHRGRPDAFRDDVQRSVDLVGEWFDPEPLTFAFPYGGRHNGFAGDELAEAARATGVACGLTTECALVEPRDDPFRWGRFNVFAWDDSRTLTAKLAGWYDWAPRLRKRLSGHRPAPSPESSLAGDAA
ncbi:MAG: polysaccharide deacetylase family protein [Pirellulaceae bacterium]